MHRLHALGLPLAQELPAAIHNGDAAIPSSALAIRNINVAVSAIDENAGGHEESGGVGIQRSAFLGAIGGVEHSLLADLQQQLAAIVRILPHHAGWRTGDPHVVVLVEVAAVEARIEIAEVTP